MKPWLLCSRFLGVVALLLLALALLFPPALGLRVLLAGHGTVRLAETRK